MPGSTRFWFFADSIYNFDTYRLAELFKYTGAAIAIGYGIFPKDLVFGPGAKLSGYDYFEYEAIGDDFSAPKHKIVTWASMSMKGEAGYMHVKDAWSTLLKKQIITHIVDGIQVVLQSKIVAETGCMLSFAISRVAVQDIRAVCTIALLPCKRYVRILDLTRLWHRVTQSFCGERRYINISYSVYESCYLYLSSLAPTSKTYANLLNYMRKANGGISLVSKELVGPWNLDARDHEPLALAVYVRVMQDVWQHEEIIQALVDSRPKSFFASLAKYTSVQVDWLSSWFSNVAVVRSLVEHLTTEGIVRKGKGKSKTPDEREHERDRLRRWDRDNR